MSLTQAERSKRWALRHPDRVKARRDHYRANNLDHVRAYNRARYAQNPDYARRYAKQWADKDPDRRRLQARARWAVGAAIKRGTLSRPTECSACGLTAPIEAAHHDYTRPLDVIWLCRPCHRRWDSTQPKSRA